MVCGGGCFVLACMGIRRVVAKEYPPFILKRDDYSSSQYTRLVYLSVVFESVPFTTSPLCFDVIEYSIRDRFSSTKITDGKAIAL